MVLTEVILYIKKNPTRFLISILALVASILVADLSALVRASGYCIWLITNGYFLMQARREKDYGPLMMWFGYEAANIYGVLNNTGRFF